MIARHLTYFVLGLTLLFSALGILLPLFAGPALLPVTAFSILLCLGSVYQSENGGFVKSRQMHRATEPPRQFSQPQVMLLMLLAITQICVGLYFLTEL
ncbi:MAG: hypothetical protein AAGJ10_07565 [Bacteroidota bacterium]